MVKKRSKLIEGETNKLRSKLPTKAELEHNLNQINQLLDIDRGDYSALDRQELQMRIDTRIKEQDEVIYPQREREGRVTHEWQRYIQKRTSS